MAQPVFMCAPSSNSSTASDTQSQHGRFNDEGLEREDCLTHSAANCLRKSNDSEEDRYVIFLLLFNKNTRPFFWEMNPAWTF